MVLGDAQIRHVVEGRTVLSYEKPQIGGGNVSNFDERVKKDGDCLGRVPSPCKVKAIRSSSAE